MNTDILTPQQRSKRMGQIRSKNTAPELALRKALHKLGLRYRLHVPTLPGRPDIVLPRFKAVIFVHGCFWHRHQDCSLSTTPRSNVDFWSKKFISNTRRDQEKADKLSSLGWRVFIVWQCEVSSYSKAERSAKELADRIKQIAPVEIGQAAV